MTLVEFQTMQKQLAALDEEEIAISGRLREIHEARIPLLIARDVFFSDFQLAAANTKSWAELAKSADDPSVP